MIRFSEAVRQYSEEKKARGLSSVVNSKELAKIRKLYKEGAFDRPSRKPVRENRNVLANKLDRESYREAKQNMYDKLLAEFRDYKESKGLGRGVTKEQKEKILKEAARRVLGNRQAYREQTILMGTSSKPQYLKDKAHTVYAGPKMKEECDEKECDGEEKEDLKESKVLGDKNKILASIREARRNVFKAKVALKENDMLGAVDATQAAGDAINAAGGAVDAAAEGAVPQNIVDSVTNVKTAVDQLATQCGIESPVDFGGDPNAGVPAVDGTMQDPNAAGAAAQPVMEGNSIDARKARLAKREALLKKMGEGAAVPANGQDAIVQEINAMTNPQEFHDIDKKDSPELVKPTTAKSKEAGNTWPTVKGTYKESEEEPMTEKMIDARIKENEENWSFDKILKEGILSGVLG